LIAPFGFSAPAEADEPVLYKAPPIAQLNLAPNWSLSAYPYWSNKNVFGADQNTSAGIDQNGGVGVLEYEAPRWKFAILGQAGQSHVTYLQAFDDMYVKSAGIGLRVGANFGPFIATFGASVARDSFLDVQPTASNDWKGSERELHGVLSAEWNPGGPVRFKPMIGFRYLELSQDAHTLSQFTPIPQDTRTSELLFAGSRVEFVIRDLAGGALKPWIFGGYTHEFQNVVPIGPSVFLAEQVAGNQFAIFPAATIGAPTLFPAHDTGVLGAGVDIDILKFLTLHAAYYHEFNDAFRSDNLRIGAGVRW
jgi:hypothetical protein